MGEKSEILREFSKEHSQEQRDLLAANIKEVRAAARERLRLTEELRSRIEALNDQLDDLNENGVRRILSYFKIRSLEQQKSNYQEELAKVDEASGEEISSAASEQIQQMINEFFHRQEQEWQSQPYSKEELEKYFDGEYLASLDMDDYILLLKRFPSTFVTHVTRQGIRDHTGMLEHRAGSGSYHRGFTNILADGHLRSPLGIHMVEVNKEQALKNYFEYYYQAVKSATDQEISFEEVKKILIEQFHPERSGSGSYYDKVALHFATDSVADHFYGSEKYNEIFLAFPSAFIARNYYHHGSLTYQYFGEWTDNSNDQWVYLQEREGMDINAGIVFLPSSTLVDKETGSRYALNEQLEPTVNEDLLEKLSSLLEDERFQSFIKECLAQTPQEINDYSKQVELRKYIEINFGISGFRLQNELVNFYSMKEIDNWLNYRQEQWSSTVQEMAQNILKNCGLLYRESENTVTAREYWEEYFNKNPQQRPKHIVYYDGDPKIALKRWSSENGLKNWEDPARYFPEHAGRPPDITDNAWRLYGILESIYWDESEGKSSGENIQKPVGVEG